MRRSEILPCQVKLKPKPIKFYRTELTSTKETPKPNNPSKMDIMNRWEKWKIRTYALENFWGQHDNRPVLAVLEVHRKHNLLQVSYGKQLQLCRCHIDESWGYQDGTYHRTRFWSGFPEDFLIIRNFEVKVFIFKKIISNF